jgi:putative molybdopterin biosynthesis protein
MMDQGHCLIPFNIGALLAYGILSVQVRKWRVGLVATGDEIITPGENPLPGQIVDSNSYMLAAWLKKHGISPVLYPVIPDEPLSIMRELETITRECDMALIFGGSSAGSKDHTVDALEKGGELLFHGVAMAPGKPATVLKINGKPVFGMPGPSIASLTVLHELIDPLFRQRGVPVPPDICIRGILTDTIVPVEGFDIFLMMKVHDHNGKPLITPVPRVFGQMMGVRADAVLHQKAGSDTLIQGQEVEVRSLRMAALLVS